MGVTGSGSSVCAISWLTKSWGGFCAGGATVVIRAGGKNGLPCPGSDSGAKPIVTVAILEIKLATGRPVE